MVTVESERSSAITTAATQAYRFAIDPIPERANLLRSHIGGARFAYNAMLGMVKTNWDANRAKRVAGIEVSNADYFGTRHFDLQKLLRVVWGSESQTAPHDTHLRL